MKLKAWAGPVNIKAIRHIKINPATMRAELVELNVMVVALFSRVKAMDPVSQFSFSAFV